MLMKYRDKNMIEVKVGDLLYYSENGSRYADSMHIIKEIDGKLYGETVIGNDFKEYVDTTDTPISLEYYTRSTYGDSDGILIDAVKIGSISETPEIVSVEFMTKNYPL